MEYLVWETKPEKSHATVTYLDNVDDSFELKRGISRKEGFPEDASFEMDPSFPKSIKLTDNIHNLERLLVVSRPVRELLEAHDVLDTEFLPVTIYNHKGRVASSEYFIVNPLAVVDCVDLDASDIDWNEIDPNIVSACFGLVLKEDQIDERYPLFRPKYLPTIVLIREDLAQAMEEAGFVGVDFVPIDEFEL